VAYLSRDGGHALSSIELVELKVCKKFLLLVGCGREIGIEFGWRGFIEVL
jgi:hypothetical protein